MLRNNLNMFLYIIPVILFSLGFHEFSHAYVSYRLGDPTARNMGRITLNPLKHLDPLGSLMLLISSYYGSGFGWAKPVPINPVYYRDRKKGTILVSLAGPLSNLLLALISAFFTAYVGRKYNIPNGRIFDAFRYGLVNPVNLDAVIFNLFRVSFVINIGLAVFNIIPVPPLDGSKILSGLLPGRYYYKMLEYENYLSLGFLLLIFVFPGVLSAVMSPFIAMASGIIGYIVSPVISIFI